MHCACPSRCRLSRIGVAVLLAAPVLLRLVFSHPTIAAEVPRVAFPAGESGLEVRDRPAEVPPPAPPLSDPSPWPGDRPLTLPSSHLSGASLLFVIWLAAEQVSADLYETLRSLPPQAPSDTLGQ